MLVGGNEASLEDTEEEAASNKPGIAPTCHSKKGVLPKTRTWAVDTKLF